MTETKNYLKNYKPDHTRYSGTIYESDFCTEFKSEPLAREGSEVAKRITNDMKFDEKCRKNLENKNTNKQYSYYWRRKEK